MLKFQVTTFLFMKLSCRWLIIFCLLTTFCIICTYLYTRNHHYDEVSHRATVLQLFPKLPSSVRASHNQSVILPLRSHNSSSAVRYDLKMNRSSALDLKPSKASHLKLTSVPPSPATRNRSCSLFFPLKCEMYSYVRYWNVRMNAKDCYESPLRPPLRNKTPIEQQKYVVFEPDRGGWNNIRMAAEMVMIFAHQTGRTLVLPPAGYWYLLLQSKDKDDNLSSFEKFYDMSKIRETMTIITMKEFLDTVAKQPGLLKQSLPAELDVMTLFRPRENLYSYLEKVCYIEQWEPGKQFIGFNLSHANPSIFGTFDTNIKSNPRLKEMIANGRKLRPYDEKLHAERVIFFPGDYRNMYRVLTHFYTYLYWENVQTARMYRRIVRDRLRYDDNIFCAAGKVVQWIHEDSVKLLPSKAVQPASHYNNKTHGGNTNMDATYYALHIRRGDFQYTETRLSAEEIWKNVRDKFDANVTRLIYISTDEKNKGFFEPFRRDGRFKLRFFDDYYPRLLNATMDFDPNIIGMIEQILCANAHTFFGTPRSSFSGYISRLRGYYRDGRYERSYYFSKDLMYQLQKQRLLVGPFWAREFEMAHKDIDDAVIGQEDAIRYPAVSLQSRIEQSNQRKWSRSSSMELVIAGGRVSSNNGSEQSIANVHFT